MRLKRRILAIFLILTMILPNFLAPFKYVAHATGASNFDLIFTGNSLVFNNDGSASFNIYREEEGTCTVNVKVYNDHDEQISIANLTDIYSVYFAGTEYEGLTIAGCTIPYDTITGCYLKLTSTTDLNTIAFYIGENYFTIDQDERIYLPTDVLSQDFQGIDFRMKRDFNEKKAVEFRGDNVSIEGNTITMDSPLVYTEGTMSFTVYNSDGTVATANNYWEEDPETHNYDVVSTTSAFAKLNTTTYDGAYMIITATGTVDLTDVKFMFFGTEMLIDPETGRANLPDIDYISIDEWRIQNVNERKEINLNGENVVVSGNTATLDSPVDGNPGRISMAFYNSDGSNAIVKSYERWDNDLQQDVPTGDGCTVFFNSTTYENTYAIVTGSNGFDLEDVRFEIAGQSYYLQDSGNNKQLNFPNIEHIQLGYGTIKPLVDKKEIPVRGDNLTISGNAITIDSPLVTNPGSLTMTFYNSDNTAATVERRVEWDYELQQDVESDTEATVKFNTTTYSGTYMIVTSSDMDLTDLKFEMPGVYPYPTVPANGRIDFPAAAEWINLDENTIRAVNEPKQINIQGDNLVFYENTVTMDSPILGNEGRLTFAFYNSDNSPMTMQQAHWWNDELGQDELDDRNGWAHLNTTSYAGAYFIVSSDDVNLADVKFDLNGTDFLMDTNHKVTLTSAMDNYWVNLDEHSIKEVSTRKQIQFSNNKNTVVSNNKVSFDCEVVGFEGRLTIGVYNKDGSPVTLSQSFMLDPQSENMVLSGFVQGKFKTPSFEGTYLTVESEDIDLTKIAFVFGQSDVVIDNQGKAYLPNLDWNWITVAKENIISNAKVPVTVNATVQDGGLAYIAVNNKVFAEQGPVYEVIDNVSRTLDVEERANDTIDFALEYGYVIKELTINGTPINVEGNSPFYQGQFAHTGTYTIVVVCDVDQTVLPNLSWEYDEEGMIWGQDAVVSHGKVEIVSVTLPDGVTTYTAEELQETVDDSDVGERFVHEGEADLGFMYDQETHEIIGGEMSALPGSTVKLKIVPDYGYQVISTQLNGSELVADDDTKTQYTFIMPENHLHLAGLIEEVPDVVIADTNKVEGGTIQVADNEFDSGSVRLIVKDVSAETLNEAGFVTAAGEEGYDVRTYLDIDLDQVFYKGTDEDVWSERTEELNNEATITLTLAEGVDIDDIVIVHNIHNSGEFEIIQIDSYNPETRTITFRTRSFSDYAIATKSQEAPTEYDVWVNGERFASNKLLINCGEGTATFDLANNKLTLNNATISSAYEYQPWYEALIYSKLPNLTIELIGTNTLESTNTYADGIDVAGGCNVIIQGTGTLNINGAYYGTYIGEWGYEGGNLTIKDATVNVTNTQCTGLWVNHDITFDSCKVNITRDNGSYHGIVSNVDGTITVTNSNINVENVRQAILLGNGDSSNHRFVLESGTVTITSTYVPVPNSEDNGKYGYGIFVQPDGETGNINGTIVINGGTLDITSTDGASNVPEANLSIVEGYGYNKGTKLADTGNVVIDIIVTFPDVAKDAWYYNSVKFAYRNGLITGYSSGPKAGKFGPDDKITRAQIVTILWRQAGCPESEFAMNFRDVKDTADNWYYKAVRWANENGIVTGYQGEKAGTFGPDDNITREQFALILQRYAKYCGKDYTTQGDISNFPDANKVSDWALSGVRWAIGVGIISGKGDGRIDPAGTATRAEAATMIMRFLENL